MTAPKTNSQAGQDLFVRFALGNKTNGSFLEIGSQSPEYINNTVLLERELGWRGIMVEWEQTWEEQYKIHRPNSVHIIDDATKVDYAKVLNDNGFGPAIDYLQIDLEVENRSTLDTLELLDRTVFDTYTFATVTFEHDIYAGDHFSTRAVSRDIFNKRGYVRVFSDVKHEWRTFEDWYVHPSLVDVSSKFGKIMDVIKGQSLDSEIIVKFFDW